MLCAAMSAKRDAIALTHKDFNSIFFSRQIPPNFANRHMNRGEMQIGLLSRLFFDFFFVKESLCDIFLCAKSIIGNDFHALVRYLQEKTIFHVI